LREIVPDSPDQRFLENSAKSNRPKTQPPHLVLYSCSNNYDYQNLSSDHLLSGVIADYKKFRLVVKSLVKQTARLCRRQQQHLLPDPKIPKRTWFGGDHIRNSLRYMPAWYLPS